MRLDPDRAVRLLAAHDHAVLCTRNPDGDIDAVPVAYAVADGHLGIPIDTVKAKTTTDLARVRNLRLHERATVLAETWHRDDWSRLWWVRARCSFVADPPPTLADDLAAGLAARYVQYRERPFASIIVLRLGDVTGWAAEPNRSQG